MYKNICVCILIILNAVHSNFVLFIFTNNCVLKQVIMELKEKVTAMKEEERWVCLMHDEMSIKQDLVSIFCWCIYKAVNFEMKYFPAKNIHAICGFESTGIQQPQWRTNRVCFQ